MIGEQHQQRGEPVAPLSRVPDDEISLWEVLAVLLRRRGWIMGAVILGAALAVAVAFLRTPTYTTAASFRPQGSEASASELLALASQFGVNVGGSTEEASPAFYAELLVSREILHRVASVPYAVDRGPPTPLADLFEVEQETDALRLEKTIERLRDRVVSVSTGRETGIVTVEIETEWPGLSRSIAQRLLDEIARFNLETRQSQATAERAFIEARMDKAEAELRNAESELEDFLQSNRQFENSPELMFRHERLQRAVSLRQQVFTTLVQSFEQASISEVRDTPVITILQSPFLPPGPDERRLVLALALGVVLGGMFGVVMAFVVDAFRRPAHQADPAREEFRRSWEGLVGSLPFVRRRS
jgi:uncharacterized protein involved in exopolysaccharide biosynthesis